MWFCCRKGDTFQGPKLGSCLTLRNELSEETHVLIKQEILLGKGTRVESRRVRERRRIALPQFVGFMVMGLVWVVFGQSFQLRVFWEVDRHTVSPFDLFQSLLVGGGLLVLYS